MIYYKVKKEADQKQVRVLGKGMRFLIANELYTEKEVQKLVLCAYGINNNFDKVEVSSRKTYFSFGARFLRNNI